MIELGEPRPPETSVLQTIERPKRHELLLGSLGVDRANDIVLPVFKAKPRVETGEDLFALPTFAVHYLGRDPSRSDVLTRPPVPSREAESRSHSSAPTTFSVRQDGAAAMP